MKTQERVYDFLVMDFHGTMTDHQLRSVRAYHRAGREALGSGFDAAFYQGVLTRPSHEKHNGNGSTNKQYIRSHVLPNQPERVVAKFIETWDKVMNETYIPVPGIKRTIQALTNLGVELVLLTNGSKPPQIKDVLQEWDPTGKFGIQPLLDKFYSALELGGPTWKKPDTRSLDRIFRDLESREIRPLLDRTLVVGDARVDIQLAKNYDINSVLVVRGNGQETFKLVEPRPTFVITHPEELIDIVMGVKPPYGCGQVTIEPVLWRNQDWSRKDIQLND